MRIYPQSPKKTNPNGAFLYDLGDGNRQIKAQMTLFEINYEKDLAQPDYAKKIKVGFVDNKGQMNIFPVRMGNIMDDNREMGVGYCINIRSERIDCVFRDPAGVADDLTQTIRDSLTMATQTLFRSAKRLCRNLLLYYQFFV